MATIAQAPASGLPIAEILAAVQRRIWLLALSVLILAPPGIMVSLALPPYFQAQARILVESQQIPEELARSTVTASAAERLQLIQQRLLTRETLLELVTKYNLYADRTDLTPSQKIDLIRSNTKFQSINFPGANRNLATLSAFTISFGNQSASVSARVVNDFVAKVLEQNIQTRESRASETLSFFTKEVERLSAALLSLEVEISSFKKQNEAALPDSLEFRRNELSDVQQRIFEREKTRLEMDEKKREIEALLKAGSTVTPARVQSREEADLANLRSTLAQRRAVLSETHPEILALTARIAALEASLGSATVEDTAAEDRARTERQIALYDRQIALLDEQQKADAERRVALETSIGATPQVELTLGGLERRNAQLQAEYDVAIRKQAEASTGEKLEVNRQAERFEVIEQAQVPDRPVSPNRPLIAGGGVAGSIAVGIGLMVLAELMNPGIRTALDMERRTGLRPVVSIPYVMTKGERRARLARRLTFALTVLMVLAVGLYAVDRYYLPLELLFDRMIDQSGIKRFLSALPGPALG